MAEAIIFACIFIHFGQNNKLLEKQSNGKENFVYEFQCGGALLIKVHKVYMYAHRYRGTGTGSAR